ncbi:acetylglutamate kinase [Buchnera aphidicola (Nipponaphis monzeni)]|uniref:Acetylglutamate kinase n=1 Tax=Buchnera aphidicola (Nipponaphis monzeni) TaxID=2495405 RepID=A0A455T9N4_9GAMM|nr:acetylglutamate kinase [Buchnera aphidicola]BBI01057.1 acetylglutamate kinase [Buchnera aphidicola (Nipponaphis monzeni)]
MDKPLVIKIGGVLLDNFTAMNELFNFLKKYKLSNSRPLLIVHGGGVSVDQFMKQFNFSINKINGIRITPESQIDIITGLLSGTANKKLLCWAKKKEINAVGLCLSDGNSMIINQVNEKIGCVGTPKAHSTLLYHILLKNKLLPIISSIGITDDGRLMNVNSDLAAAAIAISLRANLILLSDVSAILDGKGQRIAKITPQKAEQLIHKGIITNGMIIKVRTALDAAHSLGHSVDIASWQDIKSLELLFNGIPTGTRVTI